MIRKIIYTMLFMVALISLSFAQISQVWKTGQTTSYSAGDDGAIQKGVAWPSPRFTVNGDGTVTDKLTELIWTQNAGTPTVGACTGGALNWDQALSYVACLNGISYLGYNDWRMPNRKELMSLIDYSRNNPALVSEASNTRYFYTMTSISGYWSGSPNTGWGTGGGTAWRLQTSNGIISAYPMTATVYTWLVRGTSTVSDKPTISLSPASYAFGNVPVGSTSTPKEFLLANAGTQDLIISAITVTATMFSMTPGGTAPCASLTPTIAPGGNCTLVATFTPPSGGYMATVLFITSNDPATPTLFATLSGTGAYPLTVLKTGTGTGNVSSIPAGISCGSDCAELYPAGTSVTLTASPAVGSAFAGWSGGGCSGTGTCTVIMNAAAEVTAAFNTAPQTFTLTVSTNSSSGMGSGSVTSVPAGISCGADCSEAYPSNTSVTLTATPDPSSIFTGWIVSGGWSSIGGSACPGTGPCTVVMTADRTVLAQFARSVPQTFPLTVSKSGTGSGSVTSVPTGISCGADCSEAYPSNTSVTLTALPAVGSVFAGWSGGGCSGTGTCTVIMNAATDITAAFNAAQTFTLTVSRSGAGSGSVTSVPTGISCGADCSEAYPSNTSVTLTATPDPSSLFTGWIVSGGWSSTGGGSCPGTGPCTVVMTADRSVLAQFARSITLTSPNGGEILRRGSTYTITWNYVSSGPSVKIELLKGGVLDRVIAAAAPIGSGGSGSYTWSIPKGQAVGSLYRIRITSTSNSSDTDTSDANFSITK